jgi:hypothetical protein
MLEVCFTRLSPTHHRLEIGRADGSREAVELETRSCLVHDLVHFAFETEAGLSRSFYGRLAAGFPLVGEAPDVGRTPNPEGELTERIVGPLQAVVQGKASARGMLAGLAQLLEAHGEPMPPWLTEELVARTAERFRRIYGQWTATPFGATLRLAFDLAAAEAS